jgi:hypothetical protein
MPHDPNEDLLLPHERAQPEPDPQVRPQDDDSVQGLLGRMIDEAIAHYEENLEQDQADATDYYWGRPFGNEEKGRSQVVSTDLSDAVLSIMPSLLRMFFGTEKVLEAVPFGPEDEEVARQQQDYVSHIVAKDNKGFLIFHSWFQDALIRRLGSVKWWWEEQPKATTEQLEGLSEEQLLMLLADPEVDIKPDDLQSVEDSSRPGEFLFDVTITREESRGRARFEAVPNDELYWSPTARSLERAPLVAHIRDVPADELLGMGIDPDLVEENKGKSRQPSQERLAEARRFDQQNAYRFGQEDTQHESTRPVRFAEAYARMDLDGDGIAELRMFQCVGPSWTIANQDNDGRLGVVVPEVPFATLCPHPEAHEIVGRGLWDLTRDIQKIKSQVLRGTLDSLSNAIDPQQEVVANEVNMQDLLNPEVSGILRVRRPGMIREIPHQFVGPAALPVLQYFDGVLEGRTGRSGGPSGLDADQLQSSNKAAVAAMLSAAQQRIEMIARIFAETGVRDLYRGLLRLTIRHQNRTRVIRLRGQYVELDPRTWYDAMDFDVNVALGAGTFEERIAVLALVMQKQEQLLQLGSPLVSPVEYRNTLGQLVDMAGAMLGTRNAEKYFRRFGPQEFQQFQQQQAQTPPPPDPAQMFAQIEAAKVDLQREKDANDLALRRQEMMLKDDRERDKLAREAALKERELELKYNADIVDAELRAQVARDRAVMDADIKREAAQAERAVVPTGGSQ